jgi:NAD(P)H dehydrogenase (quinone)
MANDRTLLVTGASGQLGRRVLELVLAGGARSVIATTRYPDRLADFVRRGVVVRFGDFDKPDSLPSAFEGAHRMLLVSANTEGGSDRRRDQDEAAVSAAEQAGVEHLVYTSLARADESRLAIAADHVATEKRIIAGKLEYTILRQNLSADALLTTLPYAVSTGTLPSLDGDGGAAYITRDDFAQAAARALVSSSGRQTFELTGPDVIRRAVLARVASNVTGKDVFYIALSPQELAKRYQAAALPGAALALLEQGIAEGQFAFTTTDFYRLTGREPTRLVDYLAAHRHALVKAA